MNNVTMETVASLHSPYGRVKVKPFNFSREVQSTKSGQSIPTFSIFRIILYME